MGAKAKPKATPMIRLTLAVEEAEILSQLEEIPELIRVKMQIALLRLKL